jgi:hypothetical protein
MWGYVLGDVDLNELGRKKSRKVFHHSNEENLVRIGDEHVTSHAQLRRRN